MKTITLTEGELRGIIREFKLNLDSEALKTGTHVALDVCGALADLIPGWGTAVAAGCDAANAGMYAKEGKFLVAGLSLISVIPVIGDLIGKGGKIVLWFKKTFPKASKVVKENGPKLIGEIKNLQKLVKSNWGEVEKLLDAMEDNEQIGEYIPEIKEALSVFAGHREEDLIGEFLGYMDELDAGIDLDLKDIDFALESKRPTDDLVVERWQRLAGILKG
jgi:hypothetical protein